MVHDHTVSSMARAVQFAPPSTVWYAPPPVVPTYSSWVFLGFSTMPKDTPNTVPVMSVKLAPPSCDTWMALAAVYTVLASCGSTAIEKADRKFGVAVQLAPASCDT